MTTVLVAIGNSDDKLTQQRWAEFVSAMELVLPTRTGLAVVHGRWFSASDSPWQNAAWLLEFAPVVAKSAVDAVKRSLCEVAVQFEQDSIAWSEIAMTEFLNGDRLNGSTHTTNRGSAAAAVPAKTQPKKVIVRKNSSRA